MPKKPIKSKKAKKLNGATTMHLLTGVCLISFDCQICSGNHAQSRMNDVEPYTLNQDAEQIWRKHKERLLTIWRDPAGRQPGSSGFNATGYQGAGRLGLPAWGEVKFENAKMPKKNRNWPKDVIEAYDFMDK